MCCKGDQFLRPKPSKEYSPPIYTKVTLQTLVQNNRVIDKVWHTFLATCTCCCKGEYFVATLNPQTCLANTHVYLSANMCSSVGILNLSVPLIRTLMLLIKCVCGVNVVGCVPTNGSKRIMSTHCIARSSPKRSRGVAPLKEGCIQNQGLQDQCVCNRL